MADLDVKREDSEPALEKNYTAGEIAFWVLGILMIPVVPILFILLFTPHSGM